MCYATLRSFEDCSNCEIQFQPECYYRGFRDEFGMFTPVHWKILALKFAFVIIFEHVVFGVCKLIDILVPDIPASLDIKIKRERYLAKEALQDAEHVLHKVNFRLHIYLIIKGLYLFYTMCMGVFILQKNPYLSQKKI